MRSTADTDPVLKLVPGDEERLLRESVRGLASGFGPRYFAEICAAGRWPTELWDAMVAHGFVGVHLDERHGGGGLGLSETAIVVEEAAAAGCPLLFLAVGPGMAGSVITRHGTEAQRARLLPGLAAGQLHAASAIVAGRPGTNATRTDAGWVLNGVEQCIAAVDDPSDVLVVARTVGGDAADLAFIVPTDSPGVSIGPSATAVTMPERQLTLTLDAVALGPDGRIGGEHAEPDVVKDGQSAGMILAAALASGIGRFAESQAVAYANDRAVWGAPIASHQAVSHPLAERHAGLELARLMTQKAAALHDAGLPAETVSTIAKLAAADAGLAILDQAIQTHGGNGIALEYGLANLWFLTRWLKMAPVSRERLLDDLAGRSLGLLRSS